jgi:methyl-accepting chemotaxis protein
VQSGEAKLAKDFVPAVAVSNNIERYSLLTMYDIRGYSFTDEDKYLEEGEKYLTEATALAAKSKSLELLKKNATEATAKATEYETLLNETIVIINDIKKDREDMNVAAADYMKQCFDYLFRTKDAKKLAIDK